MNKYFIFKSVIESGKFQLVDMLDKITTVWIQDGITAEEKDELVSLAHAHTTVDGNRADAHARIDAAFAKIDALEKEIALLKQGTTETPDAEETPESIPAWHPWDGVGTIPWQAGTVCVHNGTTYESMINNNVWEPGAPGIDERYWVVVEKQ